MIIFDEPVTDNEKLIEVAERPGNGAVAWYVFEDKRLILEEWDITGTEEKQS